MISRKGRSLTAALIPFALFFGLSAQALAGGIDSAGGELLRDSGNPWFVSSTPTVHYCIDLDETNFGVNRAQAETAVHDALAYWQREFAAGGNSEFAIAEQSFVLGPCNAGTDLRFQLGRLTKEQLNALPNPQDFVSVVVRTSYDPVELKGRGFIYVAPEAGAGRLRDAGIAADLWSRLDGSTLKFVLAHELGHVFGLRHSSNTGFVALMRDDFPDVLAHQNAASVTYSTKGLLDPGFFRFVAGEDANCFPAQDVARKFFGIDAPFACLKIAMRRDGFEVFTGSTEDGWHSVGTGVLAPHPGFADQTLAIQMFLTPAQRVYDLGAGVAHRRPFLATETTSGTYKNNAGTVTRSVLVQLRPRSLGLRFPFVISGELGGVLLPDVAHH